MCFMFCECVCVCLCLHFFVVCVVWLCVVHLFVFFLHAVAMAVLKFV